MRIRMSSSSLLSVRDPEQRTWVNREKENLSPTICTICTICTDDHRLGQLIIQRFTLFSLLLTWLTWLFFGFIRKSTTAFGEKRTREQADSFLSGVIPYLLLTSIYSSWTNGDQSLWWLLINSLSRTFRTSHLLPHATDIRSWWLRIGWRGSNSLLVKNNDCTTR